MLKCDFNKVVEYYKRNHIKHLEAKGKVSSKITLNNNEKIIWDDDQASKNLFSIYEINVKFLSI